MNVKLIKEDDRGKVFLGDGFKVFYRFKGSVSGDNAINPAEHITLVKGRANVVIADSQREYSSPAQLQIPKKTYHRIEAITDIVFILVEEDEA